MSNDRRQKKITVYRWTDYDRGLFDGLFNDCFNRQNGRRLRKKYNLARQTNKNGLRIKKRSQKLAKTTADEMPTTARWSVLEI